jgi:hypothetical protein
MIATEINVGSPNSVGEYPWAALVSISHDEGTMHKVTLDECQHDDDNMYADIEQGDHCYSYEMETMRDLSMSWRDFY